MIASNQAPHVEDERHNPARRDLSAGKARVVLMVAAGLVFLVSLLLSRNMTGPIVYEDGLGYLANARFLAGMRVTPGLAPMSYYYPGYSLFIAPLYVLFTSPEAVYHGVLVLNAALGSLQFLLGYFLLHRVFDCGRRAAIWSALAAALYPGVLLIENYEYSDNLFRVVFLACVIAAGLFFQRVSLRRGTMLGLLAGFSLAVHPRGLGVVAITAALVVVGLWIKQPVIPAMVTLATLVAMTLAVRRLNHQLADAMYRFEDRSVGGLLSRLLAEDFWREIPVRASGQIWYLTVATGGLFPVGVFVVGVGAWRCLRVLKLHGRPSQGDAAKLYLLTASAALFTTSVIFMTPTDQHLARLDHLIYGRYNDSFVVAFIMVAVLHLFQTLGGPKKEGRGLRLRWLVGTLAVMMITALVLALWGAADLASKAPYAPISALGISVYVGTEASIPLLLATAGGALLALLVLVGLPRISEDVAVAFLCLTFVAFSFVAEQRVLVRYNDYWMNLLTLQHSVRQVGAPESIGYDEATLSLHGLNGYQFWLDRSEFLLFDSSVDDEPPRADLVIASETWNEAAILGARLIAIEPRLDQGLWVLPGVLQERLGRDGFLLAHDPTDALPIEAMASHIEVTSGIEPGDSIAVGQSRTLQVRVRHLGKASPWIPLGSWSPSPTEGAVRLVARWIPVGGTDVAAIQIAELPRTVLPGEEVTVDLTVAPSRSGQSLEVGDYVLKLGLVQEGVGWFEEAGDPQVVIQVQVTAGP